MPRDVGGAGRSRGAGGGRQPSAHIWVIVTAGDVAGRRHAGEHSGRQEAAEPAVADLIGQPQMIVVNCSSKSISQAAACSTASRCANFDLRNVSLSNVSARL